MHKLTQIMLYPVANIPYNFKFQTKVQRLIQVSIITWDFFNMSGINLLMTSQDRLFIIANVAPCSSTNQNAALK